MGAISEDGPNDMVDVRVSSRPLQRNGASWLTAKAEQAGWGFNMLPNLYEKEELLERGFELEESGMYPDDDKPDDPGAQVDKAEELARSGALKPGKCGSLASIG